MLEEARKAWDCMTADERKQEYMSNLPPRLRRSNEVQMLVDALDWESEESESYDILK